jgi:hypothetical protein
VDLDLARSTLKGILALDHPIGRIMELTKTMDESAEKKAMKECFGSLLSLQFDLVERIATAYPELRADVDRDPSIK